MNEKRCLLIVDLQNDFCGGGALPVPEAEAIIPGINQLMEKFDLILASCDMHPEHSTHFQRWPAHCIRGSHGADFHPDFKTPGVHYVLEKGTSGNDDGYSDFESTNINLKDLLAKNCITGLYVCGLATDYCVKATVLDALKHGFKTCVITDCVKAVNALPGDEEKALREMRDSGALFIQACAL